MQILNRSNAQNILAGEGGHFERADGIGPEGGEMAEGQAADRGAGFFPRETGGEIFPCELAIAGQDRPQHGSDKLAQREAD